MRRVLHALLLAAAALLAGAAGAGAAGDEAGDDGEGDSAPFMVVVRHADGRACGAALVSLRTALSSAACARPSAGAGAAPAGDVWCAVPGRGGAARRVLRVALAAEGAARPAEPAGVAGDPWAGAAADLALLELEAPLPAARAILMATDAADCGAPQRCHLVRVVRSPAANLRSGGGGGGGVRLHIVDARLEAGAACSARGPRWPSLGERTLCLAGPVLCVADRGTGVVCGGKLCGVLSRSAGGAGAELCGDTHAAPSLPRWRRFLHCAHTRDSCGRLGDCAQLCEEQWLAERPADEPGERRAPPPDALRLADAAPPAGADGTRPRAADAARPPGASEVQPTSTPGEVQAATRTDRAEMERGGEHAAPARGESTYRPSALEYEPNRPDFWTSASTRVLLKAGEYGDNAAEYNAPEEGNSLAPAPPPSPAPAPSSEPAPAAPAELRQALVDSADSAPTPPPAASAATVALVRLSSSAPARAQPFLDLIYPLLLIKYFL